MRKTLGNSNTSHVTINLKDFLCMHIHSLNSNTSHVTINPRAGVLCHIPYFIQIHLMLLLILR